MLVVNQGQVAVVKAFVGLPTIDTSGEEFKFGSIVAPGHRGIWREPLRTGKYPINPRCYAAEIVPTSIITLNWANANSQAHSLDAHLSPIEGKSREGFIFTIDLQVQIHVPDTRAPKVISMVGTMMNLVNEVLQSAVGNHFRNTLQQLEAIKFIETRHEVQAAAFPRVTEYLAQYQVETKGVYIQDVQFPEDIVEVLTTREIANQEKATFEEQQRAQLARIELEKTKGTADQQANLAASQVGITIKENEASARKAEADGEAGATVLMGEAEAPEATGDRHRPGRRHPGPGHGEGRRHAAQGEAQANTDRDRYGQGRRHPGTRPGPGRGLRGPARGARRGGHCRGQHRRGHRSWRREDHAGDPRERRRGRAVRGARRSADEGADERERRRRAGPRGAGRRTPDTRRRRRPWCHRRSPIRRRRDARAPISPTA